MVINFDKTIAVNINNNMVNGKYFVNDEAGYQSEIQLKRPLLIRFVTPTKKVY